MYFYFYIFICYIFDHVYADRTGITFCQRAFVTTEPVQLRKTALSMREKKKQNGLDRHYCGKRKTRELCNLIRRGFFSSALTNDRDSTLGVFFFFFLLWLFVCRAKVLLLFMSYAILVTNEIERHYACTRGLAQQINSEIL